MVREGGEAREGKAQTTRSPYVTTAEESDTPRMCARGAEGGGKGAGRREGDGKGAGG